MEDLLTAMVDAVERWYVLIGRRFGPLSRAKRRFLHVLRETDGPYVKELASRFDISTAGATRMLDNLESRGYVRRLRQTDDARKVKVYLTPLGQTVLAESDLVFTRRMLELLGRLDPEEQHQFLRLLRKITEEPREFRPNA